MLTTVAEPLTLSNGEDMMTMVCRGANTAVSGSDGDASFNFCEPCPQACSTC